MLKNKIIELRKSGHSYNEIVNILNCAKSSVSYHCKNAGLDKRLPQPNKLSDELILKIRSEYKTKTAKEIAEKFNISKNVVVKYCNDIKKNKKRTKKLKVTIQCKNCNNFIKTNDYRRKFCSQNCKIEFHKKKNIEKWLNGEHDGKRGKTSTAKWIKKYLIEKYGEKCMECEWSERNPYTGKIPIELEHIDGDYTNNKEENLRLLCPNCHSLTPTYKGANKKRGRPRSKYYRGI